MGRAAAACCRHALGRLVGRMSVQLDTGFAGPRGWCGAWISGASTGEECRHVLGHEAGAGTHSQAVCLSRLPASTLASFLPPHLRRRLACRCAARALPAVQQLFCTCFLLCHEMIRSDCPCTWPPLLQPWAAPGQQLSLGKLPFLVQAALPNPDYVQAAVLQPFPAVALEDLAGAQGARPGSSLGMASRQCPAHATDLQRLPLGLLPGCGG